MRAAVVIAVVIGLGAAAGVRADEHAQMRAAQQELKIARGHLQEASRNYGGHRQAALEHLNEALREIRLALEPATGEPKRAEPKAGGAEADDD